MRLPRPDWAALGTALACAAAYYAAYSRWEIWPLVLLPMAVAVRVVQDATEPGAAFRRLWFGAWLCLLAALYWIEYPVRVYGGVAPGLSTGPLALLVAYSALFTAIPGAMAVALVGPGVRRGLLYVALWTGAELWRERLLTGFGWCSPGYAFSGSPLLVQAADVVGVSGLMALAGAILVLARTSDRRWRALAAALLLLWLGYGWLRRAAVAETAAAQPRLSVGVVQGNIDQWAKWDARYRNYTVNAYATLTTAVVESKGPVDLVVWPETAMPFYFQQPSRLRSAVEDVAREHRTHLITGIPASERPAGKRESRNRAVLIGPDGAILDTMDKQHLVPFGEYVPLKKILGFLDKMVEGMGDFTPGADDGLLTMTAPAGTINLGMAICYEILFGAEMRRRLTEADLAVVISNDAWFGPTDSSYQQAAMARVRAVENRISLIRSANTGVSLWIGPDGQFHRQTAIFTAAAWRDEVPVGRMGAPQRWLAPLWESLLTLGLLLSLGLLARRRMVVRRQVG